MTPEAEQNAMLERLLGKHTEGRNLDVKAALRELLQAVQERDARIVDIWDEGGQENLQTFDFDCENLTTAEAIARAIRAQTYADLFQEENNESI